MFKIGFFPYETGGVIIPVITPNIANVTPITFRISTNEYQYYDIFTAQVSGITTPTNINFTWTLVSGSNLPRIYYAKNYPGVTTTGATTIPFLTTTTTTSTPTNISPAFIEAVQSANISVSNGDFLTFVPFSNTSYTPGDVDVADLTINLTTPNQVIGSIPGLTSWSV